MLQHLKGYQRSITLIKAGRLNKKKPTQILIHKKKRKEIGGLLAVGSHPADDISRKHGGRLPLLSTRPAVSYFSSQIDHLLGRYQIIPCYYRLNTYGRRAFLVAGPTIGNSRGFYPGPDHQCILFKASA